METSEPQLGCKAYELEIGVEFSSDGGYTWLVVRTEPRYLSEELDCLTLKMMCSPDGCVGLSFWQEVCLKDSRHVLLQRHCKPETINTNEKE